MSTLCSFHVQYQCLNLINRGQDLKIKSSVFFRIYIKSNSQDINISAEGGCVTSVHFSVTNL